MKKYEMAFRKVERPNKACSSELTFGVVQRY
jgi:hypothetical protein